MLATVGLLKPGHQTSRRGRIVVWSTFLLGIAVSLAANIAAAPTPSWQPVLVAHRPRTREHTETAPAIPETEPAAPELGRETENTRETGQVITLAEVSPTIEQPGEPTAQEIMWAHFLGEQARGRIPTGAELDRIAGTNNYGRTVLRQWREQGRLPSTNGTPQGTRGGVA